MKLSILPAALAYSLIRRGYGLADLEAPRYARSRSGRGPRLAQAGQAIKPGPGGLKPRAAAAATARCVPSHRWRSDDDAHSIQAQISLHGRSLERLGAIINAESTLDGFRDTHHRRTASAPSTPHQRVVVPHHLQALTIRCPWNQLHCTLMTTRLKKVQCTSSQVTTSH